MRNCIACNHPIADDAKFCPECGEKQIVKEMEKPAKVETTEHIQQSTATTEIPSKNKKRLPAMYMFLLIIAIVGPLHVLAITAAYLFFGFLLKHNPLYLTTGTVWFIASLATFVGIILLFLKRKKGWKLYLLSQIVYIITGVFAAVLLSSEPKADGFEYGIFILFILPALVFLGIFRRKKFQEYLR